MGKARGLDNVPPKQYGKLRKLYPHLSSREIKIKWARIQKANKGSLLKLKGKLLVKSGSKTNVNIPMKDDTHFEVGSEVPPRLIPTFPTYESSFQDYDNPQPSTSTWPHDTVPYKPVIRERDPLKLESPNSCLSDNREPYRQPHTLGNSSSETDFSLATSGSYYSPETEPVSPCQSGANAPDMLSHCMRAANLGTQTDNESMVELPQYDVAAPVEPITPVVPVAIVAPVPVTPAPVEPVVQVEPIPVAPVVPQPPVVYDIENDPELEIILEIAAPVPVAPVPVPVAPAPVPVALAQPVVPQPLVGYDIENDPEIECLYSKVKPRYQIPSYYRGRRRARHQKREKR